MVRISLSISNGNSTPTSWPIHHRIYRSSRAANPNKPFFVNYWPDEVHTVNDPPAVYKAKYDALYPNLPADQRNYLASLEHVDAQIGRIVNHIDELGLGNNTLILVTADNGAVQANADNLTSNGPFRGGKGDVFEGGVREPLIARWTGHVTAGRTDTQTVMWTPDLFPTLTQIAGVANPAGVTFDGENLSQALLGVQLQTRTKSLFWNMNRGTENAHSNPNSSGAGVNGQEVLAIRNGNWKLLINAEGTAPELYDVANDLGETQPIASEIQPSSTSWRTSARDSIFDAVADIARCRHPTRSTEGRRSRQPRQ